MTEIKECKIGYCNVTKFIGEKHCILHCEKNENNGWWEKKNNKKEWDLDKVSSFWVNFHAYLRRSRNCANFIFPLSILNTKSILDNNPFLKHILEKKVDYLNFSGSIFHDQIVIEGFSQSFYKFDGCTFSSLEIKNSTIDGWSFNKAKFNMLCFQSVDSEKLDLRNLKNANVVLDDCKIVNSYFGKSHFKNLDIKKTEILTTSFHNTVVDSGNIDTFRILKQYYESIADNITSNNYYSREQREYLKHVLKNSFIWGNSSKTYENFKNFLSSLKLFFSDGLIHILHLFASNYGQSWFLSLFWFFIFSYIFFTIVEGDFILSFNINDLAINDFAKFLNPFTKTTTNNGHYALWLLHKALSGFFIYQFIVAVKRKTKK